MMRDLSLHILDIMQNSVVAGASLISLEIHSENQKLRIVIDDNGCGMTSEMVEKVIDPFVTTRTTRNVGLGIPLLKEAAEVAGGFLKIHSEVGSGTRLEASFDIGNIDRLPLGNVAQTVTACVMSRPDIDLNLIFKSENGVSEISTLEIKKELEQVPIVTPEVMNWIEELINETIRNIFGGVLNEVIS